MLFSFLIFAGGGFLQFYLLSDNLDTLLGMRLAGVGGSLVKSEEELKNSLESVLKNKDIAVLLLTSNLVNMCKDYILDIKLKLKRPLIAEIPVTGSINESGNSMFDYIHKATGMNVTF